MSVRLVHEDREYLLQPGETLETDLGVLEVPEDVAVGDRVETHLEEPFHVRPLRLPDLFEHMERTGAPMLPRDVGLILGETGARSGDRVLDAGTGTGVLAVALGRLGADVTTYEIDPDFADVARENVELAGVTDEVTVETGDVTDHLDELAAESRAGEGVAGEGNPGEGAPDDAPDGGDGFDLLTLDTADAPEVVERAPDLLTPGGYVAVYSPFVEDTRESVEAARAASLSSIRTHETIQRELDVDERGTRPSTRGVGHTGYLTFARNE